ncbi:MAG: hypothetical protein RRZ64_05425 [Rikenellaceae bacterium]
MNTVEIICSIIGAVAVVLGGVWYIINTAFSKGVDKNRLDTIEKKVKELPCKDHNVIITDSKNRHTEVSDILSSNNEMLVEISKWVMKLDVSMIDKLAKKASPLKMTAVGEIIFEESGAKRAVDNNLDFLMSKLEVISPNTAYDVESSSLTVLLQNMGHELFNEIKSYLYNSPEDISVTDPDNGVEVDITLSMQIILKLMSIRLRDEYLTKYPDVMK